MNKFHHIETWVDGTIGRIELNRPKVLNAINRQMVTEIITALEAFDRHQDVKVIVLSGTGRAFAAGADINEMANDTAISLELLNQFVEWDRMQWIKKPIIAAVQGFALGGGFELVLSCDVVFAAENAQFGFPEVKLGVMPGAGGTVKLTKAMGKSKALEWLWTGDSMSAKEALNHGLVNRLIPPEILLEETLAFAKKIAKQPPLSIRLIKETVNKAVDHSVYEAMQFERKNFYLLFSSEDQKEGMTAFTEKRQPNFKGK